MSIFDSSLEPIKRMRRKARERRLLATREVREMLEHRFGGAPQCLRSFPAILPSGASECRRRPRGWGF